MREAQSLIQLYHTGFYVCMSLAVLFALAAVWMFFKFDIRGIYLVQSGKAEKRMVERMQRQNAETGRLLAEEHGVASGGLNREAAARDDPPTAPLEEATALLAEGGAAPCVGGRRFVVTKRLLLIHTEERI